MCKTNQNNHNSAGRFQKIFSTGMSAVVLGLLGALPATRASAQVTCVACPANGTASGVAPGIFLSTMRTNAANPNGFQYVFSGSVDDVAGACEHIIVSTDLGYKALSGAQVGRGYYGG